MKALFQLFQLLQMLRLDTNVKDKNNYAEFQRVDNWTDGE